MRHYANTREGLQQCVKDQFGRNVEPVSIEPVSLSGDLGGDITGVYHLTSNDNRKYELTLSGTQHVTIFANPLNDWSVITDIKEIY